jgi:hypothetical protein
MKTAAERQLNIALRRKSKRNQPQKDERDLWVVLRCGHATP